MSFQYIDNDVNPNEPLLYRIKIDERLYYIGCANSAKRPYRHYERNVNNLRTGKPYRKNKPDGFRAIHRHLFEASENGHSIIVELLRNVTGEEKFREEAREIAAHRRLYGEALLNATDQRGDSPNRISSSVAGFIAAAREFCSFAEDERDVVATDLWKVRDLLLRLIFHIPAVENAAHAVEHDGVDPEDAMYAKVTKRFSQFSFDYYRAVFDPHDLNAIDEPVMGMLSDDLADIYRDLAEGLDNANRGYMDEACFDWSFSYRAHWARHAVNALTTIELYRTDNYEATSQLSENNFPDSADKP